MNRALKNLIKKIGSPLLDATGLLDSRLAKLLDEPNRLLVVMFHRVITDPAVDPFSLGMCVQQKHFEAQLDFLKSRCRVVALADAIKSLEAGETLAPGSAAITFDDGYLDNLELAAPALKSRGLPATFYVATGGLQEGLAFWWDRAIAALADTTERQVSLPMLGLTEPVSLTPLSKPAGVEKVLNALWAVPPAALPSVLDQVIEALVAGAAYRTAIEARAPRMSPEQVQQLQAMGFEIGAHTVRHVDMRGLTEAETQSELVDSRAQLQTLLGQPISSFAYPSGFHNVALQSAVQSAGFDYAVTTDRGINAADLRLSALYRVGMPDASVADFKRSLTSVRVCSAASGAQ